MSGWRVACPACGAEYLLPAPFARAGRGVRCPGCGTAFRAADPRRVRALRDLLAPWAAARPGGVDAVRAARAEGSFWQVHGEALDLALDAERTPRGDDGPSEDAAALEAALTAVLGPGPRLL